MKEKTRDSFWFAAWMTGGLANIGLHIAAVAFTTYQLRLLNLSVWALIPGQLFIVIAAFFSGVFTCSLWLEYTTEKRRNKK